MKSELTSEEAFEQWAMNNILPRPYHPKLETVEGEHATRCLAVAVHYQLQHKLFTKFRDSQANIADMFGVERKKFYTSISGCTYDASKKLPKAEKEQEEHDLDLKKQKLMKQGIQQEKQKTTPEKEPQEKATPDTTEMDTMPPLEDINDDDDDNNGAKRSSSSRNPPQNHVIKHVLYREVTLWELLPLVYQLLLLASRANQLYQCQPCTI